MEINVLLFDMSGTEVMEPTDIELLFALYWFYQEEIRPTLKNLGAYLHSKDAPNYSDILRRYAEVPSTLIFKLSLHDNIILLRRPPAGFEGFCDGPIDRNDLHIDEWVAFCQICISLPDPITEKGRFDAAQIIKYKRNSLVSSATKTRWRAWSETATWTTGRVISLVQYALQPEAGLLEYTRPKGIRVKKQYFRDDIVRQKRALEKVVPEKGLALCVLKREVRHQTGNDLQRPDDAEKLTSLLERAKDVVYLKNGIVYPVSLPVGLEAWVEGLSAD